MSSVRSRNCRERRIDNRRLARHPEAIAILAARVYVYAFALRPAWRAMRRARAKIVTGPILAAVGCLELLKVLHHRDCRHQDFQEKSLMGRKTGFP